MNPPQTCPNCSPPAPSRTVFTLRPNIHVLKCRGCGLQFAEEYPEIENADSEIYGDRYFAEAIEQRKERIETLGTAEFFLQHRDLPPPRVIVSSSAHYSWQKGMKVLGLGSANLLEVDVDGHMRLDPAHLEERLETAGVPWTPGRGVPGT